MASAEFIVHQQLRKAGIKVDSRRVCQACNATLGDTGKCKKHPAARVVVHKPMTADELAATNSPPGAVWQLGTE